MHSGKLERYARLRERLRYDPENGTVWDEKKQKFLTVKCNLDSDNPEPRILDESARSLVWFLHTGELPPGRLYSCDPEDLRFKELRTTPPPDNACLVRTESGEWAVDAPFLEDVIPDEELTQRYPNRTLARRAYLRMLDDFWRPIKLKPRMTVRRKVSFPFTRNEDGTLRALSFTLHGAAEALRSDQLHIRFVRRMTEEEKAEARGWNITKHTTEEINYESEVDGMDDDEELFLARLYGLEFDDPNDDSV